MNKKNDVSKAKKDYDKALSIRFTREDISKLADLANEAGLSRADVLRHLIRSTQLPTPRSAIDQKTLVQLSAIGNNLNQIARVLNSDHRGSQEIINGSEAAKAARDELRQMVLIVGGAK
jgi:Bacterial mobilisation protein (MobC)